MLASIPWSLQLRKIRPDVALDLQGLLRSALMARLSRAGRAIGIAMRARAQPALSPGGPGDPR